MDVELIVDAHRLLRIQYSKMVMLVKLVMDAHHVLWIQCFGW